MGVAARAESAKASLRQVGSDAVETRRGVLRLLRGVVESDFALEYRAVSDGAGGWLASADFSLDGDRDWGEMFARWAGSRLDPERHSYHPELPDPVERQRFTGLKPQHRHTRSFKRFYEPYELKQLRLLCYDSSDVFVGWVGLYRAGKERPSFTRRERAALTSMAQGVVGSLSAASRMESAELGERALPAHVVLDERGKVLFATLEVSPWLTAERRARLARMARAIDLNAVPHSLFDGAEISIRRMVGERLVHLVNLSPRVHPTMRRVSALSPRRRAVAEYAAAGATATEIAREMGIRPHTVRQHLKTVYRLLEVSSRTELSRIIEGK